MPMIRVSFLVDVPLATDLEITQWLQYDFGAGPGLPDSHPCAHLYDVRPEPDTLEWRRLLPHSPPTVPEGTDS